MALTIILSCVIKVFCIILGLSKWRNFSTGYKIIVLQILVALFVEIGGLYIGEIQHHNNAWLYNIYLLVEVILLTIAAVNFTKSTKLNRIFLLSATLVSSYWIYLFVTKQHNQLFNWFIIISAFLSLSMYIIVLLDNAIFSQKNLVHQPLFLLGSSIIIYYACIIPLFGVINYLLENSYAYARKLYYINQSVNILRYSLVVIALYLYGRQATHAYANR